MYKVVLCFILCIAISCDINKKGNLEIESLEVTYVKGFVNTRIPFTCKTLETINTFKCDTGIINQEYRDMIGEQIELLKKSNYYANSNCDIRIVCDIRLSDNDSLKLCIGESNCILINGEEMDKNDTLVFLIKKYSGYYNYFSKDDLVFFDELKLFGIPENYKDLSEKKNRGGPPLPPQK